MTGVLGLGEVAAVDGLDTSGLSASSSKGPAAAAPSSGALPLAIDGGTTLKAGTAGLLCVDALGPNSCAGCDPSSSCTPCPLSSACCGIGHILSRAASPSASTLVCVFLCRAR